MLKPLEANIRHHSLFSREHQLLLAFSGGVDSVVLAHLLREAGYTLALAHCNFQLRGQESMDDAGFASQFAMKLGVTLFSTVLDTQEYAGRQGVSIQMAARDLRYQWLEEQRMAHGFDHIITAHHAGDATETILLNLVRGTGIRGLQGIPAQQGNIRRPLLFATKDAVRAYAAKHQLPFREDSSNAEVKYARNFLRHEVVPALKRLNPQLDETIHTTGTFVAQSASIVQAYAAERFRHLCHERDGNLYIERLLIREETYKETLLFEWLYQKHFRPRQIAQICRVLETDTHPGKQFSSHSHRLVVDRSYLIVQPADRNTNRQSYSISSPQDTAHLPVRLRIIPTNDPSIPNGSREVLIPDMPGLFPLRLRRWQDGDKFRPFGMKGFKKLSDFFKDRKLSLFEKEAVWILESREHIIWVVGYRLDDRCRVHTGDDRLLRISID